MNINTKEITAVLKELHNITGFRISLHGADYSELAAYPPTNLELCANIQRSPHELEKCAACDRCAFESASAAHDTVIYTCRHGLVEAVSPLYDLDTLTGYLMMGQVLAAKDDAEVEKFKKEHGASATKVPTISTDMVNSCVHIMTICAKYLTLSNAVTTEKPSLAKMAKSYIHTNLDSKITISVICDAIKCSKTSLLKSFRSECGTTVNAYVTQKRLELAKRKLSDGSKSINEVARETGFSDQSYFSKVFSAKYGISPSEFSAAAADTLTR